MRSIRKMVLVVGVAALLLGATPMPGLAQSVTTPTRTSADDEAGRDEARAHLATRYLNRGIQSYKEGLSSGAYDYRPYRAASDLLLRAEYVMVGDYVGSCPTLEQYRAGAWVNWDSGTYRDKLMDAQRRMDHAAPNIAAFGGDAEERRCNALRKLNLIHFYLGRCFFERETRWSRSGAPYACGTINDASLADTYLRVFVSGFEGSRDTFRGSPWRNLYREQLSMYAEALYSLTVLEHRTPDEARRTTSFALARKALAAFEEARREGSSGVDFYLGDFRRDGPAPSRYDFGTYRTKDWSSAGRVDLLGRFGTCKEQRDPGELGSACRPPSFDELTVF